MSIPCIVIQPLDDIGFVELTQKSVDPLLSVTNAARVSYNNRKDETDEKDERLGNFLWENKHTSPFRHQFYTFRIKAPLFVFRQHIKHQIGSVWTSHEVDGAEVSLYQLKFDDDAGCSWNEVSGRYVELTPEFYIPEVARSNAGHANKQESSTEGIEDLDSLSETMRTTIKQHSQESYDKYESLLEMGIARELARTILPQNIYTSCVWTVSLQSLLNFFELRLKDDAQFEMRKYAEAIYELVEDDIKWLHS